MEWETAYYWPSDSTLDVDSVLRLREEGRYEAGDCWCHQSCYQSNPRTGCKLFPRKESWNGKSAHFWKGPGSFTKSADCQFELARKSHNESHRYAQFYHDLRQWLDTTECEEQLSIRGFEESHDTKYSDFVIHHVECDAISWETTEILIIHKNRKRNPSMLTHIVVDLSQWTKDQISNFEYGKRKIMEEFERILPRVNEQEKRKKTTLDRNEEEKRASEEKSSGWLAPNQIKYYSRRLAGRWRASGFTSYVQQKRNLGIGVEAYFNKYRPERNLTISDMPGLMKHLQENLICSEEECSIGNLCLSCEYIDSGKLFEAEYQNRPTSYRIILRQLSRSRMRCSSTATRETANPLIIYRIDSDNPLQLNTHCKTCDEILDSFELSISEIDTSCLSDEPKNYPRVLPGWRDFTKIERALVENIGLPKPISGNHDGRESARSPKWRFKEED